MTNQSTNPSRSGFVSASTGEPSEPTRTRRLRADLTFWISLAYVWTVMILLGSIVMETVMIYPNIFAQPPESLALTMEFLAVRGPSDYFPPLGLLTWVAGTATLALAWRLRHVRVWFVLSLMMFLAEGIVSVLYFWPRNEIMFVEGLAVHSPAVLVQVAQEFETWHWRSRMAFNTIGAVAAFVGFLGVYRARWASPGWTAPGRERHHRLSAPLAS